MSTEAPRYPFSQVVHTGCPNEGESGVNDRMEKRTRRNPCQEKGQNIYTLTFFLQLYIRQKWKNLNTKLMKKVMDLNFRGKLSR